MLSLNLPPQEAWYPITEPSVFTFIQGADGGFQKIVTISLKWRWCSETVKVTKIQKSKWRQWPLELIPRRVTEYAILIFVAWRETLLDETLLNNISGERFSNLWWTRRWNTRKQYVNMCKMRIKSWYVLCKFYFWK